MGPDSSFAAYGHGLRGDSVVTGLMPHARQAVRAVANGGGVLSGD
jgi:hypothetical protein